MIDGLHSFIYRLDFYGQAKVEMFFQTPDTSTFFKLGDVHVDDGVNTSIDIDGSSVDVLKLSSKPDSKRIIYLDLYYHKYL